MSKKRWYGISCHMYTCCRLFFAACGFGDDTLGSTTMMYAKTASSISDSENDSRIITRAGRKLLVAPPSRLPFMYRKQPPHIAS